MKPSGRAAVWVNLAGSQAGWWAIVLLAAHGMPGWAAVAGAGCVLVLLALSGRRWRTEGLLVLAAVAMGGLWDSLLSSTRLLVYPPGQWADGLAPLWILALWALFATTLNVSMRWLHGRWWAAALFGAIGGPLSFAGGARLGAVQFPDAPTALATLAVGWAVLLPLLVGVARRLDGAASMPTAAGPAATTTLPSHG